MRLSPDKNPKGSGSHSETHYCCISFGIFAHWATVCKTIWLRVCTRGIYISGGMWEKRWRGHWVSLPLPQIPFYTSWAWKEKLPFGWNTTPLWKGDRPLQLCTRSVPGSLVLKPHRHTPLAFSLSVTALKGKVTKIILNCVEGLTWLCFLKLSLPFLKLIGKLMLHTVCNV